MLGIAGLPKHLPAGRQERNFAGLVVYVSTSPLFLGERRFTSMERLQEFLRDAKGASAVEYALLLALISAVIVGAVTLIGGNLKATFDYIASIFLKP